MTNAATVAVSPLTVVLLARAGVHSTDPAIGAAPYGPGAVVLYALFGAFCGLMAGFLAGHMARYVAFLLGRSVGIGTWVVCGAIAGASLFTWIATSSSEE